jgi:hypothetical protein
MIVCSASQPYPGLRPFDFGDQDYFFGRDAQIRGLRDKVCWNRLTAVVGRSGCGKSSLVRAGLIPALQAETDPGWRVTMLRPQGRPIEELTTALLLLKVEPGARGVRENHSEATILRRLRMEAMLRRSSLGLIEAGREILRETPNRLLIVVDQFEEIFRFENQHGAGDEPASFVRLFLEAASAASPRIHILLTMRLDFLGDCTQFRGLPEAISDGQFLVPNLNRTERRAAIEGPAQLAGRSIHPAVTQRLLNEVGDEADELPVLQHAIMRTWQHARGASEIALAHYQATGGVEDAISRHADSVLEALTDEQERIAKRLFKAISEIDPRGRAIRRPRQLKEIAGIAETSDSDVINVVEKFRAPECAFLMPPALISLNGESHIDISHECLLRRWSTLTGWLAKESEDGRIYRNLVDAAADYARDHTSVLQPSITRQRESWWTRARPNAIWATRYGNDFAGVRTLLDASMKQAAETAEAEERGRRQKRAIRALASFAIVFMLAAVGTLLAVWHEKNRSAELEQKSAELQKKSAELEQTINRLSIERRVAEEATRRADTRKVEIEQLARGAQPDDPASQIVSADQVTSSVAGVQSGALWIGSDENSNLYRVNTQTPVAPSTVRVGQQYIVRANILLRQDFPEGNTYTHAPSIGVVTRNTRIEIRGPTRPYLRRGINQYWAQISVNTTALPTVYFQFANGSRTRADEISQALSAQQYRIPGVERKDRFEGGSEVRYAYAQDQAAAAKLAKDLEQILLNLKYPPRSLSPRFVANGGDQPGVLELRLDLSE